MDQVPLVLSLLPASLNLLCTWPRRNTTAAITARAMRATRRMYSTMLAPRSSCESLAWSHVFTTNRFMRVPSWRCGAWLRPAVPASMPLNTSAGSSRALRKTRENPAGCWFWDGSGAAGAELAARVAELALHLATQEHNSCDHGKSDESNEEDVLHHARPALIVGELGLEPRLQDEQIHACPFFRSRPRAGRWCASLLLTGGPIDALSGQVEHEA